MAYFIYICTVEEIIFGFIVELFGSIIFEFLLCKILPNIFKYIGATLRFIVLFRSFTFEEILAKDQNIRIGLVGTMAITAIVLLIRHFVFI